VGRGLERFRPGLVVQVLSGPARHKWKMPLPFRGRLIIVNSLFDGNGIHQRQGTTRRTMLVLAVPVRPWKKVEF
jgi:hypothetical protein